jgi:hypothetical protein
MRVSTPKSRTLWYNPAISRWHTRHFGNRYPPTLKENTVHDRRVFVAYPSNPRQLGQTLQNVTGQIAAQRTISIESWEDIDVPGRFISDDVLNKIDHSDLIIRTSDSLRKKWTFGLSRQRAASRRHVFEAHINCFALILQVHRTQSFNNLGEEVAIRYR